MKADAVFSGGGMKALAFAGALKAAEEHGYDEWDKLAGTSAGAIIAAALAVGYSADALRERLHEIDLATLADYGNPRRLGQVRNLLTVRAVTRGRALHAMIESLLAQAPRPVRTFGELKGRLHVIGTDIVHRRMVVFPEDARLYLDERGEPWEPDRFPIADAVRISAGYPYMFPPVRMRHAETGAMALLVDGGVCSPFPMGIFDCDDPNHPTWGFRLDDRAAGGGRDHASQPAGRIWPVSMMLSLLNTSLNSLNELQLSAHADRSIGIPTGDVPTLAFALSDEQKQYLFDTGYREADAFFGRGPGARNLRGASPPAEMLPTATV
jgi:NTE family protein